MKKVASDTNLLHRIKQGDLTALDEVYLHYKQDFINWVAQKYTNIPRDTLTDIYHDIVIIFYQNVKSRKLNQLHYFISSYLIGVGRNYINSQPRTKKKSLNVEESFYAELNETQEDIGLESMMGLVEDLILQMKDRCQKLIKLFYFEAKSLDDITTSMNFKD